MSWYTQDEIDFLKHMAATKNAANKIKTWLYWCNKRRWPARFDIEKCRAQAEVLLFKLGQV